MNKTSKGGLTWLGSDVGIHVANNEVWFWMSCTTSPSGLNEVVVSLTLLDSYFLLMSARHHPSMLRRCLRLNDLISFNFLLNKARSQLFLVIPGGRAFDLNEVQLADWGLKGRPV